MRKYALNEKEAKQPAVNWTGNQCDCGNTEFTIRSGGSACCGWLKLTCTKCSEIEDIDLSTGEC